MDDLSQYSALSLRFVQNEMKNVESRNILIDEHTQSYKVSAFGHNLRGKDPPECCCLTGLRAKTSKLYTNIDVRILPVNPFTSIL